MYAPRLEGGTYWLCTPPAPRNHTTNSRHNLNYSSFLCFVLREVWEVIFISQLQKCQAPCGIPFFMILSLWLARNWLVTFNHPETTVKCSFIGFACHRIMWPDDILSTSWLNSLGKNFDVQANIVLERIFSPDMKQEQDAGYSVHPGTMFRWDIFC